MQFLILAYDHKDEGTLAKRMAARPSHIALGDKLKAEGKMLYGAAILNEKGEMGGSALVVDFPTVEELDSYLKNEPYVIQKVWDKIQVAQCKVGPSFLPK